MVTTASTSVVVLAGVALLGYCLNLRILAELVPNGPPMRPGTAIAVASEAVGLWLVAPQSVSSARRRTGQALSLPAILLGLLVLIEYLTGRNVGIDTLLFPERVLAWSTTDVPGRPPPHAPVGLIVTGLAVLLLDVDATRGYRPSRILAPGGALVAGVALLDQAYGSTYLFGTSMASSTAYGTALAFVVLSIGILRARPDRTTAQVLLGTGPGGVAVRRLAPVVFATVLLVGVLLTTVGRRDLPAEGLIVTGASTLLVLAFYLTFLRAGAALNHADRALRDEQDWNQTVLLSLREGVLTAAVDGAVLKVTPRWCEITGFAAQDVIGCVPPYPWWPPERVAELTASRATAVAADSAMEFDMTVRRKDGTDVEVLVTASPVHSHGGPRMLVSTYRDLTERNRIKTERRRVAEQLDHFFDISTELLCIAGFDGYFKHVNAAWEHTLGYTAEELTSRPYMEFVHPDDVARTSAEAAEQVAEGKNNVAFENRYRCRDGSYRWLSWNAVPTPHDELVYAVARDTTEQRQADDARARLAAIVNGTEDAIIGKSLDGTIISWNPAAEHHYGYTAEEAIGQSIRLVVPPERPDEIAEILDHIGRGKPVKVHNTVRVRKDGTRLNVSISISPVRDATGTVIGAASIARDITDQIKAEERFRRLVLAAPDAMLIVDQHGTIILANEQTERLFGYPSTDLTGQPVELLIPQQLRDAHTAHRTGFAAHPQARTMGAGLDLAGLRRDGSQFPVEISVAPLDTDEGTLVSAAIRDVSERREVEQAMAHARDEAVAAAQLRSQFVAMVSHEIRTPMNGVIGLTNLLLETPLQPGQRRYTQAIRTSGQALLTIINDILDFSKIEAGRIELVDVDFELDKVLEDVIQVAAEAARDKDIEVLVYYPPELPTALRGDDGRLRQALLNLLGNAVKFTEHGEVQLRAEPAAANHGQAHITFAVIDTGIGIAEKDLSRLFEPFSQIDAATNREFGGTGLGLTIARQLIELMGGQLAVESQPGHGSRFSFTIPVSPRAAPAGRETRQDRMSGHRLLIVDDNPASRHMIAQHAQAWGMTAVETPDGHTALGHLRHTAHQTYDVAIIDQHMPGLNGVELVRQISADPTIPPLALILLTSGSHHDDQIAATAGAVAVLPKPIGPSQLYNCLLELLNPDTAESARMHGPAETHAATTGSRGLILLAEDNAINQMVAVDTLAMLGYQVDVAHNGLEALQLAATKPYFAILMDCQMPKMDGYTATAELRHREEPNQHTPIIAMTAGALAEDKQRCLAAGMDDYLAKPIDPNQLQAALDRWTTETPSPLATPTRR